MVSHVLIHDCQNVVRRIFGRFAYVFFETDIPTECIHDHFIISRAMSLEDSFDLKIAYTLDVYMYIYIYI